MTFCGCGMAVFVYFCILLGVVVPVVHSSSQIHYLIYSVCLFIMDSKTTVSILASLLANIDTIQGSLLANIDTIQPSLLANIDTIQPSTVALKLKGRRTFSSSSRKG